MWKKSKISRDKSKDKIINDIWRLVGTEKKEGKKKKQNKKIFKNSIFRYIRLLFEQEKE